MLHSISTRGRFIIAAMLVCLVGGFLAIFIPIIYSETVYFNHNREAIIWYIPSKNFWLLTLSVAIIVLILILLAFKRNVITYIASAIMVAASIFIGYTSFLSVTIIDEEHLYIKGVFEETTILWSEMNEVVLYYEKETGFEEYAFILNDGSQIILWNNPHLKAEAPALYSIFQTYDIAYSAQPAP